MNIFRYSVLNRSKWNKCIQMYVLELLPHGQMVRVFHHFGEVYKSAISI